MRSNPRPAVKFRNRQAQNALCIGFVAFAALEFPAALDPGGAQWFAVGLVAFCLVVAIRAKMSSSVMLGADRIALRSILRTRTISWADLAFVEVAVGRTGMGPARRRYLVFHTKDGRARRFSDLNDSPSTPSVISIVCQAKDAVDERIHRVTETSEG